MTRLRRSFYLGPDVVAISKRLLGKFLFTRIDGDVVTGGIIIETEAYAGARDRASHAYGNRRTPRTEVMYRKGGIAYVYFCYGMHNLFNIITNAQGTPDAVLIRAILPIHGIHKMLERRGKLSTDRRLSVGPGALTKALGIDRRHNGISLVGHTIWLEDRGIAVRDSDIIAGPRVGVAYAGKHAKLPWRFRLNT